MISSLSQVESKVLFFTYPELQLHIHLMDNQVSTIIKAYYCTMGKLREAIAVYLIILFHYRHYQMKMLICLF